MEQLCQRFPLIGQKIINQVDNETLTNFKDGGRYTNDFLKKERFYWIRIIKRYNCLTGDLQEVWKKVISKTPVEIVEELAVEVHRFYTTMSRMLEWHPLFIGAASSSVKLCKHIMQKTGVVKDPMLFVQDMFGYRKITPLVTAADMGGVDVFTFLLEKAEDKNPIIATHFNWTLLHRLAKQGKSEMCRLVVEKVVNKNPVDNNGTTPYHIAAINNNVELCRSLMEHLMDKNPRNCDDDTPLHLAAFAGSLEVCRLLIETCVDKNHMDDVLRIPLHEAAWHGHVEVVGLFMANIVNKHIADNKGQEKPHLIFNRDDLLLYNNSLPGPELWLCQTPLLSAIKGGYLNVCKLLIEEYNADVNLSDDDGITPLHLASKLGHLEICRFLCKYVLDKNTLDKDGVKTPLLSAILGGHLNVCNLLIEEHKVDVNLSNNYGMTPLHVASRVGHLEICKYLCKYVSNKNTWDNNEIRSPLLCAILGGHLNVCNLLIGEHNVDVNLPNDYGTTPLHLASELGHLEICKFLCKYVLDKNTYDSDGKTPHDLAVSEHKWNIVSFLNKWSPFRFP